MQQTNNTYPFYGPEDIKRYLSGSMSAQEMHDMEKAALKDPLLADAIDGFRGADPAVTDTHLNAIKASVLGLSQREPVVVALKSPLRTQWWRWAAAACSLALIAGTAWWFTQRSASTFTPLANNKPIEPVDTAQTATLNNPAAPVNEPVNGDLAISAPSKKQSDLTSRSAEDQAVSANAAAPLEAMEAPVTAKTRTIEASPPPADMSFGNNSFSREQANNIAIFPKKGLNAAISSPNQAPNSTHTQPLNKIMGVQPVVYVQGEVVNTEGIPIPYASVSIAGNNETTTKNDGSFVLPIYDSSLKVSVNSVGFQPVTATLQAGRKNKVILSTPSNNLDEVVIVGYNNNRKNRIAPLQDARKAQAAAVTANEIIYPEEGWGHFYEELGSSLGVDKAKKTKTLQIKFTVDENGDPVDFEIVESPDAIMAKKAIEFIKKAKWKNFKLDKNALVKIEVN